LRDAKLTRHRRKTRSLGDPHKAPELGQFVHESSAFLAPGA